MKKLLLWAVLNTARFKFVFIALSTIFIALCFNHAITRFNTNDPEPEIQSISIELTRKFEAFTVHVETGLYIRNFSQFNMLENKFIIDMIVWFRFNPAAITLDTIDKFSFENGRIVKRSSPDIRVEDSKTFVKYDVIVELKSDLDYRNFPLEDHKLSVVLTNQFVTPYEVIFEVLSTDFVVDPNIFISNWKIRNIKTNFGIDENFLNQLDTTKKIAYPKAVFTIDFIKAGTRKALIIFGPIFIIFLVSLFSFFLTLGNIIGRATLSISALTAILGYRFVIEQLMPKVGYFTTTDHVYIILLIFAFLIFLSQMILTRLYNTVKQTPGTTTKLLDQYRMIKDAMFVLITCLSSIILGVVIIL